MLAAYQQAHAQQSTASAAASPVPAGSSDNLDEIVVNGIKRGELILPTTVTSTSAYGLDLGVMDTPRNNTLLSKAQLDALNIQNPGGFSYLTSSSYSDASFGEPNVPRIRGQYADMFFNGMRDSFTFNGYGAPISFNSVDSIDIIKGPASVQAGPGAGVGGEIDITTKMPTFIERARRRSMWNSTRQQKRRASFDVGGPLTSNMAARVSFTSDDSGSYYYDMYFHQQSLFAVRAHRGHAQLQRPGHRRFRGHPVPRERRHQPGQPGAHRQRHLPHRRCLRPSSISGFGTEFDSTGSVQLNGRTIIDEPPGTGAHSLHVKGQIIQTFKAADDFTIVNNTFYDYMNRYNQTEDYYADTAKGSYTVENKTDFKIKFPTGAVNHDVDAGFTYRYAHVLDIQNFVNEPVSVFDLSAEPQHVDFSRLPAGIRGRLSLQCGLQSSAVGAAGTFSGAPGPDGYAVSGFLNGTVDSNLQDAAIFLEHQMKFSPEWSVLYGLRGDLVQLNDSDPLGGPDYGAPPGLSAHCPRVRPPIGMASITATSAWSTARSPHVSTYLTYNRAQYVLPTANDGAVAVWGEDPTWQLRQNTLLEEVGVKLDLLDKALFISSAVFKQDRTITTGVGGLAHTLAHIKGAEIELNYQPDPHFFATASYSYLHTMLDTPAGFYNFPAQPGRQLDGAGTAAVFQPNQTFQDPGVPQHLFNVLANYKHESGFGVQANIQVTGPDRNHPVRLPQRGGDQRRAAADFLRHCGPAVSCPSMASAGYYQSPKIPWQYTLNAAAFYSFQQHYTVKFSIYNLTDRHNLTNDIPFLRQRLPDPGPAAQL